MSAEYQINMLKQIPPLSKVDKRRKLRTAIVLSLATFFSILFFVFAYLQKLESDKNAILSMQLKIEANQMRLEAERQRITAEYEKIQAIEATNRLNSQLAITLEELQNCKKSK